MTQDYWVRYMLVQDILEMDYFERVINDQERCAPLSDEALLDANIVWLRQQGFIYFTDGRLGHYLHRHVNCEGCEVVYRDGEYYFQIPND